MLSAQKFQKSTPRKKTNKTNKQTNKHKNQTNTTRCHPPCSVRRLRSTLGLADADLQRADNAAKNPAEERQHLGAPTLDDPTQIVRRSSAANF
jgi:hypothetical protein